jgi:hypothetical protein
MRPNKQVQATLYSAPDLRRYAACHKPFLGEIMRKSLLKPILLSIAAAYILIAVLAFLIFMFFRLDQPGDISTLIQTLTELALVPIAIIGFFVTISDLRKSQQLASLDLNWSHEDCLYKSYVTARPVSSNFVTRSLVLTNAGTSPSIHYRITLIFPISLGEISLSARWRNEKRLPQIFIFGSSEEYISFPETRIDLGAINFWDAKKLPDQFGVHYKIYSDRAQYIEGILHVSFKK